MSMTEDQKKFCIDIAAGLYREGFSDWLEGADEPKQPTAGQSYHTGFNEAKKMHPLR